MSTQDLPEIGSLEIAGQQKPFKITFRALRNFQSRTGLSFHQMADIDLNGLAIITHEGLKAGARMMDQDPPKEEDVLDFLDADLSLIIKVSERMQEEMSSLFPKAEGSAAGEEKKA
jgi:hypothetical protein